MKLLYADKGENSEGKAYEPDAENRGHKGNYGKPVDFSIVRVLPGVGSIDIFLPAGEGVLRALTVTKSIGILLIRILRLASERLLVSEWILKKNRLKRKK